MKTFKLSGARNTTGHTYENSTQKWLPIENIRSGIVILKDGRYIKVVEVLPVNFYLKSETEQENIIYYFFSYLKIAPDNLQIRVLTQKADLDEYLKTIRLILTGESLEVLWAVTHPHDQSEPRPRKRKSRNEQER